MPTFGKPTSATSATSFSSSRSQRSSPCSPCSANDGRPPAVRQEAGVAATSSSARGGEEPVAVVDEIGEHVPPVVVAHDRALGHRDHRVGAAGPVAALALPVDAVVGPPMRMVAKREQRRDVAIGHEPDVAAVAAVAAVRAALRDVRLAAERDAARAAVTAVHMQVALVDEARHTGPA